MHKHWMFRINALEPDQDGWEFEEGEIGMDIEILQFSGSNNVIISKEMLHKGIEKVQMD